MDGQDLNGILKWITQAIQWQQAGNMACYNSVFSTAIGGYPIGSILQSTTKGKFWLSTADNNTNNPDVTATNWSNLFATPSDLAAEVTARTNAVSAEVTARTNADNLKANKGINSDITSLTGLNTSVLNIGRVNFIKMWRAMSA